LHLLSDAEMRRIAEKIFKLSDADETEVENRRGYGRADALCQQHDSPERRRASAERLGANGVDGRRRARRRIRRTRIHCAAWWRVEDLARSRPRNPDLLPMPGPQNTQRFRATLKTRRTPRPPTAPAPSPASRNGGKAKTDGGRNFHDGRDAIAIANTRGLFATHRQTRAEFSITILESDSSGWAKANAPDLDRIDPRRWLRVPAKKSVTSRKPGEAAPRKNGP